MSYIFPYFITLRFSIMLYLKSVLVLFSPLFLLGCAYTGNQLQNTIDFTKPSNIPSVCKDSTNKFLPIRSILLRSSYNQKAQDYQPIDDPKGFIVADINQDQMLDFLFIERSGSNIRLISCLSKNNNNVRRVTPFKVHEMIELDFQTIFESIQFKAGKLQLFINKHEHNWGSDTETRHYSYNKKNHDFILDRQEVISSSGDGLRSDTYEFFDFVGKRYKKTSTCGYLEEVCQSWKQSGRIILPQSPATLFKANKLYARLIPD